MISQETKILGSVQPTLLARIFRFGCVGGLVFAFDFTLVYLLGKVLEPLAAVSIAYVAAVSLHFGLNKWWVFGARTGCSLREVLSYVATAALCWGCTVLTVKAALASLTDNLLVAKMIAVMPTMLLGFGLMRLVVFRQTSPQPQQTL